MFCTKCGNELPLNAKFCTKCGTKVEVFQPGATQPNPNPQKPPVSQPTLAPQPQSKKNEKVTKPKNSEKISNKNKNEN